MMISVALLALASTPATPVAQQRWFTNLDYPSDALGAGAQGVTEFQILIGIDGKPKSCQILKSAGHPSLDKATCKIVMRRGRWKPALDDSGQAVESRFSSRFTWIIPR
jgi:protein TonB